MLIWNLITLILRFCQFYPTYLTKDVDNEFIHSAILRFCLFYPIYPTNDVDKAFIDSDT